MQDAPDRNDLLAAVYLFGAHGRHRASFPAQPGWAERLKAFVNEREPTVNWFFVHDGKPDGAGYFVGYERESNRRVGFIGLSGFRSDPVPAAEWIPVRGELIGPSHWSSAPVWIYSRPGVGAPTRGRGRAAALGLCAIRKPSATGRPRRTDGNDRLRNARADRVGRNSHARILVHWPLHDGTTHSGADDTADP